MPLWKPVLHRRRKQVDGLSIHGFELCAHVTIIRTPLPQQREKADRLLGFADIAVTKTLSIKSVHFSAKWCGIPRASQYSMIFLSRLSKKTILCFLVIFSPPSFASMLNS